MKDLSIVIVNFNTRDLLRKCLMSIYTKLKELDLEAIVVDNASSDDSARMVKQEFPQVKLVANNENLGFSVANNKGIEVSSGKYVLFLNSDIELIDDSLKNLIKLMEEKKSIGAVGCKLLYPDRTVQPSCGKQLLPSIFIKQLLFGMERGKYYLTDYDKEREVDWCTGACLLVRRKSLDDAGHFDEKYFIYYEDNDLCMELKKKGWRVYYSPRAQVVHYKAASREKADEGKIFIENLKSYLHFYKKHYNVIMQVLLRAVIFLYCGFKLLTGLVLFIFGKRPPLAAYVKGIWISLKGGN
ncbi:MAG: glycosyltransferase family 2 protein [Candidatus Saganbacteria bacterium]|nr:glycosyltransferase family 2 protein [Candidatus Saganbacteria bacterium]